MSVALSAEERIEALKKIQYVGKHCDAWGMYWQAMIENLRNSVNKPCETECQEVAELYRLARICPVKIAVTNQASVSEILAAEVLSARTAGVSLLSVVQGTVDTAVVLKADVFMGEIPSLESIGIDSTKMKPHSEVSLDKVFSSTANKLTSKKSDRLLH